MDIPSWANSETLIIVLSTLGAFATFLGIALPLVQRNEKKEKYREVVDKKRRALMEQAREDLERKPQANKNEQVAAKNMAAMYRLQKLAGNASDNARKKMLQAGIRNTSAPLYFLLSRIIVPVVFCLLAMMFMAASDREISDGMTATIFLGAFFIGYGLPGLLIKNMADKRKMEIQLAFPDSLDMMLICVQGGIGVEAAIAKIADTVADHSETLAEELGILSAELGMLNDRKSAYQGFASRVGSAAGRNFATAMMQAEQYGTSVTKAMRVLADEQREIRMATAEQKAAALPPKLTVPMILFFLPALFVTILGPAFLSSP